MKLFIFLSLFLFIHVSCDAWHRRIDDYQSNPKYLQASVVPFRVLARPSNGPRVADCNFGKFRNLARCGCFIMTSEGLINRGLTLLCEEVTGSSTLNSFFCGCSALNLTKCSSTTVGKPCVRNQPTIFRYIFELNATLAECPLADITPETSADICAVLPPTAEVLPTAEVPLPPKLIPSKGGLGSMDDASWDDSGLDDALNDDDATGDDDLFMRDAEHVPETVTRLAYQVVRKIRSVDSKTEDNNGEIKLKNVMRQTSDVKLRTAAIWLLTQTGRRLVQRFRPRAFRGLPNNYFQTSYGVRCFVQRVRRMLKLAPKAMRLLLFNNMLDEDNMDGEGNSVVRQSGRGEGNGISACKVAIANGNRRINCVCRRVIT